MRERHQDIDEKAEELRGFLSTNKAAKGFLERFEMSWIYHDNALEGVIYTAQELNAALTPGVMAAEASLMPIIWEIRNHKAAVDYVREEAQASGRKHTPITLPTIKHIHDLLCGSTPEAQAARAATERREKNEKELARERERTGYRKDMPLHRTYFHDIAQPAKVPSLLEKFVEYTGSAEFREQHPLRQAPLLQHQFMQIFPFTEHSGKVGRMLTNLILLRHNYLPCIIHSIDRQRYYESLRGPVATFRVLFMDALENSIDNAIKFFRDLSRKYKAIN